MRRSAIALRTPADAFVANLATKCAAAAAPERRSEWRNDLGHGGLLSIPAADAADAGKLDGTGTASFQAGWIFA